jgi:hypothetical protein
LAGANKPEVMRRSDAYDDSILCQDTNTSSSVVNRSSIAYLNLDADDPRVKRLWWMNRNGEPLLNTVDEGEIE